MLHCPYMEKAMAPHSSTLAWKIPWMEEPGGLQSMGLQRVGHDWETSLWLFIFMHWRRKWQPTPVFLPGESQGWGSLVGCRLWGHRVGHDGSDSAAAAAALISSVIWLAVLISVIPKELTLILQMCAVLPHCCDGKMPPKIGVIRMEIPLEQYVC